MRKRRMLLPAAVLALVLLASCGKNEQPQQITIRNDTLPDVQSFAAEYEASREQEPAGGNGQILQQSVKWKPHGVYTHVGSGGTMTTSLFRIISVDYDTSCAVLTYIVKDQRGLEQSREKGEGPAEGDYLFESEGEKVAGLEERTGEDGIRHVIIYLSNEHYLDFAGREKIETARYCYRDISYLLKYEG